MRRRVAGPLARLRGESGSLRGFRHIWSRRLANQFEVRFVAAAGIGARQADATPQVRLPGFRKCGNRGRNARSVGALHKPQAAAQTLIEGAAGVSGNAWRDLLPAHGIGPIKVALVEAVAIEREPARQGIESRDKRIYAPAQPR